MEYKIKGIVLNEADLTMIHEYYEASCSAECIKDNTSEELSDVLATEMGYAVREEMQKYDLDEDDALNNIFLRYGFKYDVDSELYVKKKEDKTDVL